MQVMYRAEVLTPSGLQNPTGFFGPATRAKANELCATAPVMPEPEDEDEMEEEDDVDAPTAPSPLMGGEGDIVVQTLLDGGVTIDLGDSETVLEFEVEAVDSDVSVNRVDFVFNNRPWLFFDEVNLLVDGVEVASLSGSGAFTNTTGINYRARFSGLDLVIREDEMVDVALELVVRGSMAGNREAQTVTVSTSETHMRFVDGAGFSETGGVETDAAVSFFDAFSDGEIRATIADNSPESATILLNESSRTNGVTVLNVDLEARDSDMEVKEFWVELSADTGTTTIGSVINRARLYTGNTLLDTQAVSGNGTSTTVEFDRVDYMISRDDIREFRVEIDFNRADNYEDKLPADFTVGEVTVASENRNFEPHTETLNVDEEHRILTKGLVAEFVSVEEETQGSDDEVGRFTFRFDLTAYGDTFYVPQEPTLGTQIVVATTSSTAGSADISSVTLSSSNAASAGGGDTYRVSSGQTRSFTATVFVTDVDPARTIRVILEELQYFTNTAGTTQAGSSPVRMGTPEFRSAPLFISEGQ